MAQRKRGKTTAGVRATTVTHEQHTKDAGKVGFWSDSPWGGARPKKRVWDPDQYDRDSELPLRTTIC